MISYPLQRVGNLFTTKAAFAGPKGVRVLRLLLDTGSAYTIVPVEVLESLGCSPTRSLDHIRMITGSGYLTIARVQLVWMQCLGRKIESMQVVAHTLPLGSIVDGLLGMDFLTPLGARLLFAERIFEIP